MKISRRLFLKGTSAVGSAGALGSLSLPLWSGTAEAVTDHKVLVCVFLYGANDSANTVIPYDSATHAAYLRLRGDARAGTGVGMARSLLTPTALTGGQLALNPSLVRLAELYNSSNCAVLANVGPLVEPTVKAANGTLVKKSNPALPADLPPKLRSHNDQQAFWQSFGVEGAATGWGGRIADLFVPDNPQPIFTGISTFGNALFLAGQRTLSYQVTGDGPLAFSTLGTQAGLFGLTVGQGRQAMANLVIADGAPRMFERDLNRLRQRSVEAEAILSDALTTAGDTAPATVFQTEVGQQLRMVLRLIRAGKAMGLKRQIFHVGLGGFDHHDGLVDYTTSGAPAAGTQEALLADVDTALGDFWDELGRTGLRNEVTTFTGSDFGRTYQPNNDGSDHGWGGHHFVLGGSVSGGRVVGRFPQPQDTDPAWLARGVMLPQISTQQLAFTLGRWFGASPADLSARLPGIDNFGVAGFPKNLGFML